MAFADGIFVREEIIQDLPYIPSDALRVLLVLMDRHRMKTKVGLTLTELGRATDLGTQAVGRSLLWLAEPTYKAHPTKDVETMPFISIAQKSRYFTLTVDPHWLGETVPAIPFTYDNTDETKLLTLEKELRRLSTQRATTSGLTSILKGEELQVVSEIERDLGRGLTVDEAFLAGKLIQGYNPDRLKKLWREKAAIIPKNQLRAIYGMLMNGKLGRGAVKSEGNIERVVYKEL